MFKYIKINHVHVVICFEEFFNQSFIIFSTSATCWTLHMTFKLIFTTGKQMGIAVWLQGTLLSVWMY